MKQSPYNKTQAALVKAVTLLCKPLIRLLIEKGVTFPQFRELMKALYVEVADEHFALENNGTDQKAAQKTTQKTHIRETDIRKTAEARISDSRIFVLTGIHRKDIKRIREQASTPAQQITSSASLSGEIIARWLSTPDYLDKKGKPVQLLKNAKDDEPGFDQLVCSVNKDVRPKAILDEWLRLNIVRIKADTITLNQSAFVTNREFNELAYYLGHNIHDHLASCVNNILAINEPMMERSVYYASLTEHSVNKLRTLASKKGDELLQQINKQAIKLYDADKHKEDANYRIRLGVYWYQTQLVSSRIKSPDLASDSQGNTPAAPQGNTQRKTQK